MSSKTARDVVPGVPESGVRILRNGTLNLGGQMLYALLQVIVVIVLARYLGTSGLGHYYTMMALVLIGQLIVESGAGTLLTQRISQSPNRWRRQVAEAAGMFTLISTASALLILALGGGWFLFHGQVQWFPAVVGAAIACGAIQWQRFGVGVFQAFELFVFENIAKVLQGILLVCGMLALAISGALSMNTAMAALATSHVVASSLLLVALSIRCGGLGWRFDLQMAGQWLRQSVPLGWGDVLRKLTWNVDTIMLALFVSPGQVGMYSVAYRPLAPLNWIPRAILSAAFPSVSRQAAMNPESIRPAFARSTRLLVIAGLPLAIGICVAAQPLIMLSAGEQFAESVNLLRMLIWVIVLSFVSQQFRFFLAAVNRHGHFAGIIGLGLGVKIALQWVLVPWWGCYGACLGSLLAEAIFTIVGLFVCLKMGIARVEWTLLRRAGVASLLMGGTAWLGHSFGLLLLMPWLGLAASLYLVTCYSLGVFRKEEIEYAKRLSCRITRYVMPSLIISGNRAP